MILQILKITGVVLLIALSAFIISTAHAFDADIYTGFYQNSTLRSSPGNNNEYAEYVQGIKAGHNIGKFRMYGELQTLLDGYNGSGTFHPASIRYTTGVSYKVWKELTVDVSHSCWHPIDSDGRVEEYNLLMFIYHFGEPIR